MAKVKAKSIAIIGSGVVGRATGKGLLSKGYRVVFFDIKQAVVSALRKDGYAARRIETFSKTKENFDVLMLSVSTPTIGKRIALDHFDAAVREAGKAIAAMDNIPLVVIRSTVPPGTLENRFLPILEKASHKKVGQGFNILSNPEFLREASAEEDFLHPRLVVIGSEDKSAGRQLEKIYRPFGAPIARMEIREAEMMKYVHNLLNAAKISFFNEMRLIGEQLEIDSDLVFETATRSAEAIWNPRYGTRDLGPFGGACLPKDTQAFFTWAKENFDFEMPVLKGAIITNELIKLIRKKQPTRKRKIAGKELVRSNRYGAIRIFKRVPLKRMPVKKA